MKIWMRRVLAMGLLSLGAALIFFPYNETRSGSIQQEVVSLQTQELIDPGEIRARFPGQEITDITGPELNPDDYPDLWRVFINLGKDWPRDTAGLDEWNRFQEVVLNRPSSFRLVIFREKLIACSIGKRPGAGQDGPDVAMFNHLGRYNPGIRRLSESDLSDFPAIIKAANALQEAGSAAVSPPGIPKPEWDRMKERYLNPLADAQTFYFNGEYYGPEFGLDIVRVEGRVRGLRTALAIIGVLCLVGGCLVLKRLYVRKRGIMVNPRKIAVLFDAIVLVFAIPSAYLVVNTLLEKLLFIPRIIDDDFIVFMGNFFFVAGILLVTLYTSRFTSQSVDINDHGIAVDGMAGKGFIPWESFASLEFSDEYVAVGRVGVLMPRQLQKRLKLVDTSGRSLMVNEPQLSSVKRQIIQKFQQYSPVPMRDEICDRLAEW